MQSVSWIKTKPCVKVAKLLFLCHLWSLLTWATIFWMALLLPEMSLSLRTKPQIADTNYSCHLNNINNSIFLSVNIEISNGWQKKRFYIVFSPCFFFSRSQTKQLHPWIEIVCRCIPNSISQYGTVSFSHTLLFTNRKKMKLEKR